MDKIDKNIREKQNTIVTCINKIETLKNEIKELEEKKYIMCDHKFQLYPVYSGSYPERSFICTKCGYEVYHMV